MTATDQRLIEDYIPIEAISAEARREKSVRKGHIATLHLWWARRPLVAACAAVYGALALAPADKQQARHAADFVADLCKYPGSPSVIAEARRHLLAAHAERLTAERVGAGLAPAQATVTAEDIEAGRAPQPRVLDMFAGGGAIPDPQPDHRHTGRHPSHARRRPPHVSTPRHAHDPAGDLRQRNAQANLADKAGGIQVTVEAEKADGFDPAWLRNAVLEPLEEADVRVEEQG